MQYRVNRVEMLTVQEQRSNKFGRCRESEEFVPDARIRHAGTLHSIPVGNLLLYGNQRFQRLQDRGKIILHLNLRLIRGVLMNVAIPGILSIVISDGLDVPYVLLQKSNHFLQIYFIF